MAIWQKTKHGVLIGYGFCLLVYRRFVEDGCAHRAAALAYTSLLSLVPLLTVSFAVLAAFPVYQNVGDKIQDFIFQNFVVSSANVVQQHIQAFMTKATQLSATGSFFLLVTAILLIFNIEQAFNSIWRVKHRRKGVSAFLSYWAVLTLMPILIGVGFAVTSYLASVPFITGAAESLGLKKPLLAMLPYLLTLFAFTLLYITVPNCKVRIRYAFVGGLLATLLFELAKAGFAAYITHFPTYKLLYGALAALPIFLVWVYVSWLIILFGAEVNCILERKLYLTLVSFQ